MFIFNNIFILWYLKLYLELFTEETEKYAYYTHPSTGFYLAIRCFSLLWLLYSYYTTIRQFDSKTSFLSKFTLFGSVFIISPLIVYLIILMIDNWARKFYQELFQSLFNIFNYISLLLLFTPDTPWSGIFPYFEKNLVTNDGKVVYKVELKELLLKTMQLKAKYEFHITCVLFKIIIQFKKELCDGFDLLTLIGRDINVNFNDELMEGNYIQNNEMEFEVHGLSNKNKNKNK